MARATGVFDQLVTHSGNLPESNPLFGMAAKEEALVVRVAPLSPERVSGTRLVNEASDDQGSVVDSARKLFSQSDEPCPGFLLR